MDAETEFLKGLIELQYGRKVKQKLRRLALHVSWARGWPEDQMAFWNAEAFMWRRKVEKSVRENLAAELAPLQGGKNLDLGCGSYSYLPSVGFDLSEKMLQLNGSCREKIQGNLERPLPFPPHSFDSVTAIFVLNYVRQQRQLCREIYRILRPGGRLVAVLAKKPVNSWQRQKEVKGFSPEKCQAALKKAGFAVTVQSQETLLFFHGYKAAAKTI